MRQTWKYLAASVALCVIGVTAYVSAQTGGPQPAQGPADATAAKPGPQGAAVPAAKPAPLTQPTTEAKPAPGVKSGPPADAQDGPKFYRPVFSGADGRPAVGSVTKITDSANGVGNTVVVGNSGQNPGVIEIRNSRNGVGNKIIVTDGAVTEVPPVPFAPVVPRFAPAPVDAGQQAPAVPRFAPAPDAQTQAPAPLLYRKSDNPEWAHRMWDPYRQTMLYLSGQTGMWFEYNAADETYRPVQAFLPGGNVAAPGYGPAFMPPHAAHTMREVDRMVQNLNQIYGR